MINTESVKEAEQAILYSALKNKDALSTALIKIKYDDFSSPSHLAIFKAMQSLWHDGQAIDEISVKSKLDSGVAVKILDEEIKWSTHNTHNYQTYIDIIKNYSRLRELSSISNIILKESGRADANSLEVLSKAEQMLIDLAIKGESRGFEIPKNIFADFRDKLKSRSSGDYQAAGLSYFIDQLDEITLGLHSKDLIIIAGRPSSGKTSLCGHIAINNAVYKKVPIAFFSLEMPAEMLLERALANLMEIDSWKLRTGRISQSEWSAFDEAEKLIKEAPIYIDETPNLSVIELHTKAKRLKMQEPNLGLIIVDYMQLMMGSLEGTREQEVSSISRGLKQLAKELELPVIAVSQLSRAPESREDKRPRLSDLRESGGIEQDGDLVIFLYRDYIYTKDESQKDDCEIIIGKHRNGMIANFNVMYLADRQKFYSLNKTN